jgi:hypothetical protein
MTERPVLERADVVEMLASFGDRRPEAIPERIDSMELAWLVHQVEQRYGIRLDLDDDQLVEMGTVTTAVLVLRSATADAGSGTAHG